jgi:enamine deaminase RidA (YjgF/YER057c/UK114 family)
MHPLKLAGIALALFAVSTRAAERDELRRIVPGPRARTDAIVVSESRPLVYSEQILAPAKELPGQAAGLIVRLEEAVKSHGGRMEDLVRVNLYGTSPKALAAARTAVALTTLGHEPTLTEIETVLPAAGVEMAADFVLALDAKASGPKPETLAPGTRAFISGQAEKGDGSLAEATWKTMESLERTLQFLGMGKGDAVQVKCFFQPMSEAATVRAQIAKFFGPAACPPIVLVEWIGGPIEIEMVAGKAASMKAEGEPLEFLTPPGMTASPVYARVVRVGRGPLVFTKGFVAKEAALGTPEAELRDTFEQLGGVLSQAGSDWRSLVKATYYVSDAEVNKGHNAIRPQYFDPQRPPAASKAMVKSIGAAGRHYTMDFVAAGK